MTTTMDAPAPTRPERPEPAVPRRRPWTAWRLASRLARREVRRRPGRTLLVALLVAIPTTGMVVSVGLARSRDLSPEETWRRAAGQADVANLSIVGGQPYHRGDARVPDELPQGWRVVTVGWSPQRLRTEGGQRLNASVADLPLHDPLTDGMLRVHEGRAPESRDDVVLPPAVAAELGVGVGDTVELDRPVPLRLAVTGIGTLGIYDDSRRVIVVGPGNPLRPGIVDAPIHLVDVQDDIAAQELEAWQPADRPAPGSVGSDPRQPPMPVGWTPRPGQDDDARLTAGAGGEVLGTWGIGALALTVVGVVIVSAFAAGARRQLTTLGLLAANGATPVTLRRVLGLQGFWTGVAGAVAGTAIGAAVLTFGLVPLTPWVSSALSPLSPHDVGIAALRPTDVVPIVALSVLTATVAARMPARAASRIPVLAALAGRRPVGRMPAWVAAAGIATTAAGTAMIVAAIVGTRLAPRENGMWGVLTGAGSAAVLLGACATTPAVVSLLGPLGHRLRGPWRLACRDLARRRGHSAAVVSAVLATAMLAVVTATFLEANVQQQERVRAFASPGPAIPADQLRLVVNGSTASEPPPRLVERLVGALPGARAVSLTGLAPPGTGPSTGIQVSFPAPVCTTNEMFGNVCTTGTGGAPVLADDAALGAYRLDDAARRQLHETGALATGTDDGRVRAAIVPAGDAAAPERRELDVALVRPHLDRPVMFDGLLVTPERARELGLVARPGPVLIELPGPVTVEQQEAARRINDDVQAELDWEAFPATATQTYLITVRSESLETVLPRYEALIAGAALVLTLAVVAAGLALAAVETRAERDLLAALGAPPAAVRATSGRRAFLLVLLGVVLAVPAGWIPTAVALAANDQGPWNLSVAFPGRMVAVLVVVVPLVAGVLTSAGSAVALRIRPVRASALALD